MDRNSLRRRRLDVLAAFVPRGARIADVGTGHGALAVELVGAGRVAHCIATERTQHLLAEARRRARACGEPAGIELRAGDGLGPLRREDRLDAVVIAGMGARRMIRILGDGSLAALGIPLLVLQPQTETERLRRWLAANGFTVVGEAGVVERGRRYVVLAARVASASALL